MTLPDPLGLVGVKLGPYVVREQVTEGGVAVIYKGEHEALQSVVAIKVLIPELVEEGVRTTFEQLFLRRLRSSASSGPKISCVLWIMGAWCVPQTGLKGRTS